MKHYTFYSILSILILSSCNLNEPQNQLISSDICVYGDSEASFVAAIQAAKLGKTVSLVAPNGHIGGFIINGLSSSDIGDGHVDNKRYVSGLSLQFYKRISVYYGHGKELGEFGWEPKVAEIVIKNWLEEYPSITVYYNERLAEGKNSVIKDGTVIEELVMESGKRFAADVFIDAMIEGDLMAFSGVSYTYGREGNAKYGETINGEYPDQTYRQFKIKVDPYVSTGDPSSGLISTVFEGPIGELGNPSPYIMGFCFRLCLTDSLENSVPIEKPFGYNSADYEIYRRYFAKDGMNSFFYIGRKAVPNAKTDMGSWHDLSANLYGMNVDYPDAGYMQRDSIYNYHKQFTLGLIWFLQNDEDVPDQVKNRWRNFGLPKDEYIDNNHWPRLFYVRSSRRMVSDYVITEHNGRPGVEQANDPIGVTYWPFDMHAAKRVVKEGYIWNEGFVFDKNVQPFGISYKALVPKPEECSNLLVAACPSSSYVGYSALRLVWVFMTMGQATGAAASIAIDDKVNVQNVEYEKLLKSLNANDQVVNGF